MNLALCSLMTLVLPACHSTLNFNNGATQNLNAGALNCQYHVFKVRGLTAKDVLRGGFET